MANVRPLSPAEQANLAPIKAAGNYALLFITWTQLDKGILDATQAIREFLRRNRIHNYGPQSSGARNKVILPAILLDGPRRVPISVSAYVTTRGDTRFL